MPKIEIYDDNSFELCLRKFKRSCEKAGIAGKLRQIEYYEKPTAKRKRKHAAAVKRHQKKVMKEQESRERERTTF